MSNEYFNHCMLTGEILEQERKTSRKGSVYCTGHCQIKGLEVKVPFRAFGDAVQHIQVGETLVLIGSFRYEAEQLLLMVNEVQVPIGEKPENHCQLTLRAGKDGVLKYSQKGVAWSYISAALSMGKDKDGKYRDSLWVDVKGFAKGDDESTPLSIASLGRVIYSPYLAGCSIACTRIALSGRLWQTNQSAFQKRFAQSPMLSWFRIRNYPPRSDDRGRNILYIAS